MGLQVHADLDIEVDGITARLVDDGPDLVLTTDRPVALLRSAGPRRLAGLARLVSARAAGLPDGATGQIERLRLRGPHGDVASLRLSPGQSRRPSVRPTNLLTPRARRAVTAGLVLAVVAVAAGLIDRVRGA